MRMEGRGRIGVEAGKHPKGWEVIEEAKAEGQGKEQLDWGRNQL